MLDLAPKARLNTAERGGYDAGHQSSSGVVSSTEGWLLGSGGGDCPHRERVSH